MREKCELLRLCDPVRAARNVGDHGAWDNKSGGVVGIKMEERLNGVALGLRIALSVTTLGSGAVSAGNKSTHLEAQPPTTFFKNAAVSWSTGAREDATFWLYVAQLRYRARLASRPDLPPSGEPALFASLMQTVGRPINEYAFGDVPEACRQIDRALRWDEDNPDLFNLESVRRSTRAGLVKLRDDMLRNIASIRQERAANGLINR